MKIMLCEDDENLGMLLREYLQAKGFDTELCTDGEMGYKTFIQEKFNLCVLDVMMPKKDGFSLAKDIRQVNKEIPIIFLTAKALKEDIFDGFKLGADDYLTKPFATAELLARIRALLRRTEPEADIYRCGCLTVDPGRHIVTVNGREVALTQKEFEVLCLLLKNRGQVLSRERLIEEVWGYAFTGESRTVDVHVRTLRQKLGEAGAYIETVRGYGYKISRES